MTQRRKNVVVQLRPAASTKKQRSRKEKDEVSAIGKALRALGGIGGAAAGSYFGAPAMGASVGTGLGAALSRWLGMGDYVVRSNTLLQRASANGMIPAMHKEGQSIIVRHREFITEVRGSTTFAVQGSFNINPGLSTTFPWLSGIASQYSEYRIRGLVYHYVPTSGFAVSGTNPAIGSVMLQTSYRATESSPTSKMEMLNEYWASEAKPSDEFCHPIECDPKQNPFNVQYVRSGALPATENQLMYDLGRTTLAVTGQQASSTILGDLWVTYEIELMKPVLTNVNNQDIQSLAGENLTGVTAAAPFGTAGNFTTNFTSLPVTATIGGTTIAFAAGLTGTYAVTAFYEGVTAFGSNAWSISAGGTLLSAINGASTIGSNYTVGTGMATYSTWFTASDPSQAVTLTGSLSALSGSPLLHLYITEANPLALNP